MPSLILQDILVRLLLFESLRVSSSRETSCGSFCIISRIVCEGDHVRHNVDSIAGDSVMHTDLTCPSSSSNEVHISSKAGSRKWQGRTQLTGDYTNVHIAWSKREPSNRWPSVEANARAAGVSEALRLPRNLNFAPLPNS